MVGGGSFSQALSLEAANEVDVADARRVNAAAGGNKVLSCFSVATLLSATNCAVPSRLAAQATPRGSPQLSSALTLCGSVCIFSKAINYGEMTAASWAGVLKALGQPPACAASLCRPAATSSVLVEGAAAPSAGLRAPIGHLRAAASDAGPPPLPGPHPGPLGAGDCFLDLGSGRGCLVLQAALACPGLR